MATPAAWLHHPVLCSCSVGTLMAALWCSLMASDPPHPSQHRICRRVAGLRSFTSSMVCCCPSTQAPQGRLAASSGACERHPAAVLQPHSGRGPCRPPTHGNPSPSPEIADLRLPEGAGSTAFIWPGHHSGRAAGQRRHSCSLTVPVDLRKPAAAGALHQISVCLALQLVGLRPGRLPAQTPPPPSCHVALSSLC